MAITQSMKNVMQSRFMDLLVCEGILADGAIGTEIYRRGMFINRSYDELNISAPDLIRKIHRDYLDAGALLIKTNTFTANRAALAGFGLEEKTAEINRAGVRLARSAAGKGVFVAGSIGPVSSSAAGRECRAEWASLFAEQAGYLADAGVDVILFETFTNLDELYEAVRATRGVSYLPVIAQVSVKGVDEDEDTWFEPERFVHLMSEAGADVVGVNCANGPQGVFGTIKEIVDATDMPTSAMPNAGLPKVVQGRMLYLATPEYMAEYARRYAGLGVQLIGGCCGTTPAHIREMKMYLKAVRPSARVAVQIVRADGMAQTLEVPQKPASEKSQFGSALGAKFAISVEMDPPLGTSVEGFLDGARFLKEMGVDAVNIADGPRAMPRMSPIALGSIIKEKVGIEPIIHYCCRDRNILGMQMDLLGAAALGLNNILIITGDPPKMGNYPDATAVFDIDSIGLIRFAANLNRGLDFANRPIKDQTAFLIGCGCNTGAVDPDGEAERYMQKVAAGAEFVFSQPVYDLCLLEYFLDKISAAPRIPFFIGILPLVSFRNAEFLHNEVPGMQIPADIMERMRRETTKEGQQRTGIAVAREILAYARKSDRISGAYIFPPFGKYRLVEELLR